MYTLGLEKPRDYQTFARIILFAATAILATKNKMAISLYTGHMVHITT